MRGCRGGVPGTIYIAFEDLPSSGGTINPPTEEGGVGTGLPAGARRGSLGVGSTSSQTLSSSRTLRHAGRWRNLAWVQREREEARISLRRGRGGRDGRRALDGLPLRLRIGRGGGQLGVRHRMRSDGLLKHGIAQQDDFRMKPLLASERPKVGDTRALCRDTLLDLVCLVQRWNHSRRSAANTR